MVMISTWVLRTRNTMVIRRSNPIVKAWKDVVAAYATVWERRKRHAGCLDTVDVATRDLVAGTFCDVLVEADQVRLGFRTEYDLKRHAWRLSGSLRGGRADA